jgi:tRNA threonylcarbamoyladenosine biosynthesis protein TsaB
MPIILAIETSAETASAALLRDDVLLMREFSGAPTHSATILPMVQSLLQEGGITLAECNAIAFGAGPGSFTGVRTACGVAQGLAFGAGVPVLSVVTLQAMAHACRRTCDVTDVLAVLDARMGEVYWAQYRFIDGAWQTVIEPTLSASAQVTPVGSVHVCGSGIAAYTAAFDGAAFMLGVLPGIVPHAVDVAYLAMIAYGAGALLAAGEAQPIYLRNKIALTTQERAAAKVAA